MCGIFAILNIDPLLYSDLEEARSQALASSRMLRHRGPDWSGLTLINNNILCHERLAIVGLNTGSQPIVNKAQDLFLCVNGEIYNHLELRDQICNGSDSEMFQTDSDCEIIMHLYKKLGSKAVSKLRGMYSFILYDKALKRFVVARDPIGITPLYYGYKDEHPDTMFVASELKALKDCCNIINTFPPGHYYDSNTRLFEQYYQPKWYTPSNTTEYETDFNKILNSIRVDLEKAVKRRLMCEVPFGVLLSGGLDSSLIASITVRQLQKLNSKEEDKLLAINNWPKIHSFSIGLTHDSPDIIAAKKVAEFLGTKHHAFTFSIEDGLNALKDVIYHLETYDVTTIRASTPMYLLSRKIKAMGVKMVLSGEGSDEIFGGYLYFHKAPNEEQLQEELVNRVKNLHLADCLRANKSTMAFGVEARVPFLDIDFLETVMNINPEYKIIKEGKMEKFILRKAFDNVDEPYLPSDILWRQKEQFSDGVGYSWIDALKEKANALIKDEDYEKRGERFEYDIPDTKEAYWYRLMFDAIFEEKSAKTVKRWIPRHDWGCSLDPSGRAQTLHAAAYKSEK